jgi:hypothetical protein
VYLEDAADNSAICEDVEFMKAAEEAPYAEFTGP